MVSASADLGENTQCHKIGTAIGCNPRFYFYCFASFFFNKLVLFHEEGEEEVGGEAAFEDSEFVGEEAEVEAEVEEVEEEEGEVDPREQIGIHCQADGFTQLEVAQAAGGEAGACHG